MVAGNSRGCRGHTGELEGEWQVGKASREAPSAPFRHRIAVVTTVHRWGDPRVFERETATYLAWGCEVHVFFPMTTPPARAGWSEDPGLHFHLLTEPRGRLQRLLVSLGTFQPIQRAGPFDVVHFHDPELIPAMALLAARWPRTYFLYDVHEDLPLEVRSKRYLPGPLQPAIALAMTGVWRIARSVFEGFAPATEAIARHWPPERTRIVHNYPKALYATPADEAVPLDRNRLLYVGGLTEVRGIREMFDAVQRARARFPDLRLDLVGPVVDVSLGPLVARRVAEGWCRHTPWLAPEQLAPFARGAAIGLVPYLPQPDHLEALPTKIFEYMAMGIPILASDFPLWRELIENTGIGRVAPPTGAGLAIALETMLGDPARLAEQAARGRAAYARGYRWETERENLRWHLDQATRMPRK